MPVLKSWVRLAKALWISKDLTRVLQKVPGGNPNGPNIAYFGVAGVGENKVRDGGILVRQLAPLGQGWRGDTCY